MIVRVVTDVAGIDKEFDYLVPAGSEARIDIGTEVRLPLGARRVGGWVVDLPDRAPPGVTLKPLAKVRGFGPDAGIVDLAAWAAWRWAGRRSAFLRAASADHAVPRLPRPGPSRPPRPPASTPVTLPGGPGVHVVEVAPATDPTSVVAAAAQLGPTLVVVPTVARASVLAGRLRRAGATVALLPGGWVAARAGEAGVVVGARTAAFGPCPGLAAVVVLDAHDQGLVSEAAPTWSALTVAIERAARHGAPLYALTPTPTPELLDLAPLTRQDRGSALAGWAVTEVVDRRLDDPRSGLWSPRLVAAVRSTARVALILNRTGRVRLLACAACGELARCEVCHAALASPAAGRLRCPRCGLERPTVCPACRSMRVKNLRVGVARAREEIEALAGRPVGEVSAATTTRGDAGIVVGTEALLHRLDPAAGVSVVAFVDFDQELMAPRVTASSQALALVALASRIVRGRSGRVVIQTRQPDHPVVRAAVAADPIVGLEGQDELRRALGFPPHGAIAVVRGEKAGEWVTALAGVTVAGPDTSGAWLVRAGDAGRLCSALAARPRPAGGAVRVAVEPAGF